jgi:TRAP-type C4-dicarboxylate transport system substrate-binding protein
MKRFSTTAMIAFISVFMLYPIAWAAEGQVYQPRLSYHWFPEHHSAKMANLFVEECKKATDGRLDIQIFPSGQLFKISQVVPAVSQGSVEMGGLVDVILMRVNKNFFLTGMQRFFNNFQQKRDFWEKTPQGRQQWDGVQQKLGIKVLAYIPVGPATYFCTERPLDSMAALKGLKARVLIPTEKFSLKPLGVNYVAVSTSEVYSALKQGMINMVSTVPSAVKAYSWWDYLKYAQLPYTFYADAYIIVNTKWWDTLPPDIQDIVLNKVSPVISKKATEGVMAYSDNILKELAEKQGGRVSTLSESEQKKFIEMERTKVWPALAENMDPAFYEAAKKFVGQD